VTSITPFFIANVIVVEAKRSVVELLAKRDDVKAINSNRPFKVPLEEPEEYFGEEDLLGKKKQNNVEWNVNYVKAPTVWSEFGTTGTGIYANADTGVSYTHPALVSNYKGYNAATGTFDHNYNWWDGVKVAAIPGSGTCGINSQVPCDDNSHGTHTTGTAVGQNGIGVAPGAKWIACRNMDRGYGSVASYLSCLQFFLAPTDLKGLNPNPNVRPLAIGNSYGCPASEGCRGGEFTEAVESLRAAGIFMSVSAGNSGSRCSTINDQPAIEASVVTVGATGFNSDVIASFSSRGPVGTRIAPTIAAPGSSVRSCIPGNGYASFSGTSMASPHVGGFVNLIAAVCPDFAYNVNAIERLLQTTARRLYTTQGCGGDSSNTSPNNVFGYGMLDVLAAARLCKQTQQQQ
jgi:serine protease AprX